MLDIDWAPDNKHIAAACSDGRLRILSAEGDLISESPEHINPENGEIVAVAHKYSRPLPLVIMKIRYIQRTFLRTPPKLPQALMTESLEFIVFLSLTKL